MSVYVAYQERQSSPENNEYVFTYHIHLKNHNPFRVQLLRRKWIITNGFGETEIVEGDGVVGKQPELYPEDEYEYISGAAITSPFGMMAGFYYFVNKETGREFTVRIPEFRLETNELLN